VTLRKKIFLRTYCLLAVLTVAICSSMSTYEVIQERVAQKQHGKSNAIFIAECASKMVIWDDRIELKALLEKLVSTNPAIRYVLIERGNRPYVHTMKNGVPKSLLGLHGNISEASLVTVRNLQNEIIYDIGAPIRQTDAVVHVGLSRAAIDVRNRGSLLWIATLGLAVLIMSIYLAKWTSIQVTREVDASTNKLQVTQYSVDHAGETILWLDSGGQILYANERACRALEYSLNELLSMNIRDIDTSLPKEEWQTYWKKMQQKKSFMLESVHRAKNGNLISVEIAVNHINFGGIEYHCVFARDITERKRMEDVLRRSEEQIRLLLNTTAEAIFGCDLNGICTFCNHACARLLGYKDPDELIGKNMHYLMHHSHPDGNPMSIEECPTFHALQRGENPHVADEVLWRTDGTPVHVLGYKNPDELIEKNSHSQTHLSHEDGTAAPLDERATFQAEKRGEHLHYDDAILWRADGTCFHAEYWNHLQLVGGKVVGITGSFYDITKRKQMEEALRASEQWHRRVAENMSDVIWVMDFTGRFIYISPSIMQMLGYAPEEATMLTFAQMTSHSSKNLAQRKFEECLAMAKANKRIEIDCFEIECLRKDGLKAWGEVSVGGMYDTSGNVIGFQGIIRDITRRIQAQEALRESEQRHRLFAENVSDVLWTMDFTGKFTYMSPSILHFLGVTPEEAVQVTFRDITIPSSLELANMKFEECVALAEAKQQIKSDPFELEFFHKNGSTVWGELTISGICEPSGKVIGIQGVTRDITKRKQAEEILHQSEERWRAIFEHSKVSMMLIDPGKSCIDCNLQLLKLLGYESKEELLGLPPSAWAPPFQPDGEPSIESLKRHDQIAMEQGVHSFEWAERRKNGEEILVDIVLSKITYGGRVVLLATKRDITERKKFEEALRESEERYRILFESSRDALMTMAPPTWRFTSGNSTAIELFGTHNLEEFISIGPWDVSPEYQPDGQLSADKAKEMIEKALQQGENFFEWTHKRLGGEEFSATVLLARCEVKGRVFVQATVRDITSIKQVETELREQTQLLSTVIDGIPDVIALQKPDQTIIRCNKAGYAFHGLPPEDVQGRKCYEVLGRDAPCEICATKIALDTKQISHVEKFLPERKIWIEARSIPVLDKRGNVYLVVEELRDISDRKRMEVEQAQYNATLEANNKALAEYSQMAESATRAKSAFLANMSHEIRTPMTAILGYAQYLLNEEGLEKAPPHRVEAFRTIERNGRHLLTLINDILDLTKIESGKLETEQIMCSPMSILADVTSLMRVHAMNKKLPLKLQYVSPIPQMIKTDPTRLKQILVNLVNNAIKFTESGEVRIAVRLLKGDRENHKLSFDIIDTGIGITPEQIKLLFQHFTQADASTTRKFGGSGLGLVISKRLAELLGGDITVSSIPDTGSIFTFTVSTGPLEGIKMINNPSEAMCQHDKKVEPFQEQAPRLNCRILLAEDTPDIQNLIKMLLIEAGATVTAVDNGHLAVETAMAAHREGNAFDVILMDMQMPVMDGYAATRKMRLEGYKGRIVALTAHSMQGDREKCIEAGCDDFISKPIDPDQLIEIVAKSMNSKSLGKKPEQADSMVESPDGNEEVLYSQYADRPVIARMLGEFVGRLDERVCAMQAALGASQTEDLRRLAHQLKGTAGSYGYPSLTAAAKALEDDAKMGRLEFAAKEMECIVKLSRAVIKGWKGPADSAKDGSNHPPIQHEDSALVNDR
jgi:PAS domain S-box-containing protein